MIAEADPPVSISARGALVLIRSYKLVLSPWLPHACRFHPTCSEYASAAIRQDGFRRGVVRAARRLARCHPWSGSGGLDLP